ncbi:MATE family efflux transporter [Polluticoccus soli]|uniref:MATE family efflux transporter n=1 Tax=Polluticoccus soli TaxID=3034150 RepID=UPI0023E10C0B|nr:MATE family efflux transporter [Flavipsychrobacter sp. JY13-12]
MKVSVSNKDIIRLALPISLALLIPQINFLTNTAFLGRLGETELGVNGIAGIFYLTLAMIGYGLSNGMQVQMARRAGEGDNEGLAKTMTNGVMLAALLSLVLMVMSMWLAPLIFGLSLRSNENVFLSVNFIYIRVWGLPFLMITQLFNAFYISIHKSKYLIYDSIASTIMNVVLDYLLIFGKGGFPEMGLQGAAVASVIAEMFGCMVMFGLFYFNRLGREFPVMNYLNFDSQLSQRTLKVSSPLIVQFLFSIGGWQVFFIFIEHLGERELAASQILRSVFGIVSIGTWAFAATCNSMVSNLIGQGKQSRVIPLIKKVVKLSFIYVVIISILLLVFSDAFLSLYRDDPALVAFAKPSLRVIVTATLIMAISTVVFNGVVGTGNTVVNLLIEIICVGSYLVYCSIVIEQLRMPLHWAWGSEFVYWTSLLVTCLIYLRSGRWKGKKI